MRSIHNLVPLALAGVVLSGSVQATLRAPSLSELSTGESTNGSSSELWLSVLDPIAEVSYTLDLGITMAMIRATNADAGSATSLAPVGNNLSATFQHASDATNDYAFWIIDPTRDAAWAQFAAVAATGSSTWAVMGADAVGSNQANQKSLLLTVSQGSEAAFRSFPNASINSTQAAIDSFVTVGVNGRPNHLLEADVTGSTEEAIAINGSSFDTKADNTDAYFGNIPTQFSGANLPLMTNSIGESAWFYDINRSGTSNLSTALATINEFDNLAGDAYWGFVAEDGATGRYLLSYVMPRFLSTAETEAAVTFENSFARLAGVLSLTNPAGESDTVIDMTEGFLRRLALGSVAAGAPTKGILSVAGPLPAVPEPSSWALMALGLLGLGARARRHAAGNSAATAATTCAARAGR